MLRSIFSFFTGNRETINVDEVYSVLHDTNTENHHVNGEENTETNGNLDEETSIKAEEYACLQKIGFITGISDDAYIIDNKYTFTSSEKYPENVKVSFVLYYDEQQNANVSNVKVLTDNWENVEVKSSKWCVRALICKVVGREKRNIILEPGELIVDLNNCSTNFLPMVGDWLKVEAKCMIDEGVSDLSGKVLEVLEIKPLRNNIVNGMVRQWDNRKGEGIINNDIYFNVEAIAFGYVPKIRDKVVTEVIESDNGKCSWRSLTIVLEDSKGNGQTNIDRAKILSNQRNTKVPITVSKIVYLDLANGKSSIDFETFIENESKVDYVLLRIDFYGANEIVAIDPIENKLIRAEEQICLQFKYKHVIPQNTFNIITYVFNDFKLTTTVIAGYKNSQNSNTTKVDTKKFEYIKGQSVGVGTRFVDVSIPAYTVPSKLYDLVYNRLKSKASKASICEELDKMKPSLRLPLGFNTYEDKFHNLIHLNEIYNSIEIEQYNQERACFIKDGEYLLLEVENLAERRPSLIIGDKILVTDPTNKFVYEGFIHKIGARHVYLKFASRFHEAYNNEDYSITVQISRSSVKKMHHAINLVCRRLGKDFLFPSKVVNKVPQVAFTYDQYSDNVTLPPKTKRMSSERLRLLIEKHQESNADETQVAKLKWHNQNLNFYQKEAVRNILLGEARPLPYIIFGPPGTGKTITLVETVLQIITLMPHSRILIATPSNSSADLIATRLINSNRLKPGDLVRLVGYKLVLEDAIPLHLVPYSATLNSGRNGTTHSEQILKNGLRLGCDSSVIGQHRITVGTCSAIGGFMQHSMPKGHFTHIIIDEAGQATEPEIMIPLSFLDLTNGQIILAGDPMQLGPVVGSSLAIHYGLQESYLERLLNRFPYVRDIEGFESTGGYDRRLVTKLLYNYRCLPDCLEIYNKLFYNSDLKATISYENSNESRLLEIIKEVLPTRDPNVYSQLPSLIFHCVYGENYRTPDSPSWFNPDEASYVFDYVNKLYKLGLTHKDIGIITPYVKQVKYIRTVFAQAEFESPKIGSVEEFQGQEFNVILLSTVRSESKHISSDVKFNLGFVANPRRVNVALSRAKCLTVIIGNPHVLSTDSTWNTILQNCHDKQCCCGCEIDK